MEIAFSNWNKSQRGSTSTSEDGDYSCTLYKDENNDNQIKVVINEIDGLSNPRLITLQEAPEEGAEYGTPRRGPQTEYFFLRGAKRINSSEFQVFRGNLFKGKVPRLVVRAEVEEARSSNQQQESASEEEYDEEHV